MKSKAQTTLFLMIMMIMPLGLSAQGDTDQEQARVIGLYMYADWCGTCERMDPELMEAVRSFEGQPFLLTRFDFTDDFTSHQSSLLARQLNVQNIFNDVAGSTGFVVLVDVQTGEEAGRLTVNLSREEMEAVIDEALN